MSIDPINSSSTSIDFIDDLSSYKSEPQTQRVDPFKDHHMISYETEQNPTLFRFIINFLQYCLKSYFVQFDFFHELKKKIFGLSHEELIIERLKSLHLEEDHTKIPPFLKSLPKNDHEIDYLLAELLEIEEIHPHFKEILAGANVKIEDNGFFFHKWQSHNASYKRTSSHHHQKGMCYGFSYILFWIDADGHTRFQFEKTPLKGFTNRLYHLLDYLTYKNEGKQQGIIGSSVYTEKYPLTFQVNLEKFKNFD